MNCGDVSFSISSGNHFTAVEFLMKIKKYSAGESSCLPLSDSLSFSPHFEVKRSKARNVTLRGKKELFIFLMYLKRLLMHCLMFSDGEAINKKNTKTAKC